MSNTLTAMQELINELDRAIEINKSVGGKYNEAKLPSLNALKSKATELLHKEKDQIMKANDDGWSDGRREKFNEEKNFLDSEDYYNKTYNQ